MTQPLLLLWDIDGTLLLKASKEHAQAIHAAIKRVYHVAIPDGQVEAAGRTDIAIARSILTLAGVSAARVDERLLAFRAAAVEEYSRRVPSDLSDHLGPHVPEVLDELEQRPGVRHSLVTGNLEPIARMKLRAAGIGGHFPKGQGGFGSDSEDRAELPDVARARAQILFWAFFGYALSDQQLAADRQQAVLDELLRIVAR